MLIDKINFVVGEWYTLRKTFPWDKEEKAFVVGNSYKCTHSETNNQVAFLDQENSVHWVSDDNDDEDDSLYFTSKYWKPTIKMTASDNDDPDIQIRIAIRNLYRDSTFSAKEFNRLLNQESEVLAIIEK